MADSGAGENEVQVVQDFPMLEQAYFSLDGQLYRYRAEAETVAIQRLGKTLVLPRAELAMPDEVELSITADAAHIAAHFYPDNCRVDDFV
jgi:hypothetical protein